MSPCQGNGIKRNTARMREKKRSTKKQHRCERSYENPPGVEIRDGGFFSFCSFNFKNTRRFLLSATTSRSRECGNEQPAAIWKTSWHLHNEVCPSLRLSWNPYTFIFDKQAPFWAWAGHVTQNYSF